MATASMRRSAFQNCWSRSEKAKRARCSAHGCLPGLGRCAGGMPLYKYVGNRILTWIENRLLKANLSEFHSGYRIYSTRALSAIPFDRNANGFHFDTEIIIQLLIAGQRIVELPIPTFYGDEISYVNGIPYAWNVVMASLKASLQDLGIFYDRKFDCAGPRPSKDEPRLTFRSPQSLALDRVKKGSRVLDIGGAGGYMAPALSKEKACIIDGSMVSPLSRHACPRSICTIWIRVAGAEV